MAEAAPYVFRRVGFEVVTSLGTVKTLTVPKEARYILVQACAQNVRWRDDGADPTAGVGFLLTAADGPVWFPGDPSTAEFLEATAGATLLVGYYA